MKQTDDKSTVYRRRKDTRFTLIDNDLLENPELTWKAKALMAYLLSRPDNWRIYVSQLSNVSKDGKTATATALKELISYGLISRTALKDAKGRFQGYEYIIEDFVKYDRESEKSAIQANRTENRFSVYGEPENGFSENGESENGKTRTNNTDYNNTELNNTERNFKHTHTPEKSDNVIIFPVKFKDCPYSERERFDALLDEIAPAVDKEFYFKKISRSAKAKGATKEDWRAYIEMWLEQDLQDGKLQIVKSQAPKTAKSTDYTPPPQTVLEKLEELRERLKSKGVEKTKAFLEAVLSTLRSYWKEAEPNEQTEIEKTAEEVREMIKQRYAQTA